MTTDEQLDLTPDPSVLLAICETDLGWRSAIGELIDNAFDAGATTVSIEMGPTLQGRPRYLLIRDNGGGCATLGAMLTLGRHSKQKTTQLGRYGIGAKDAALWMGGGASTLHVSSVHSGTRRGVVVSWKDLVASGRWDRGITMESESSALMGDVGTIVTVSPIIRRVPEGKQWAELIEDLGYLYAPAIKRGRQIVIQAKTKGSKPEPITRYELPKLEPGHVDTSINVDGRGARVYVGIVAEGQTNKHPGITYTHGFRVIKKASGYGCGSFDFTRIAGIVDLDHSWILTKNKDNISAHAEELYEAVFSACKELLKRAEVAGQRIESTAFAKEVEGILNETLFGASDPNAKAVRGPGDSRGSKRPTGTGGKHKRAKKTQDGSTFMQRLRGGLRVHFAPIDSEQIGYFDPSGSVVLAENHPWIVKCRADRNAMATASLAIGVLAHAEVVAGLTRHRQQHEFPFMRKIDGDPEHRFNLFLGKVLARPLSVDGVCVVEQRAETTFPSPGSPEEN